MKTLHFFRQHEDWIEEELQAYIAQRLPNNAWDFVRSYVKYRDTTLVFILEALSLPFIFSI